MCQSPTTRTAASGRTMWTDKHAPLTRDDLAVHKKKVADVADWFEQSFRGVHGSVPILLLTGESGIGKTATVRVLAREMSALLVEWTNPIAASLAGFLDDKSDAFFNGDKREFEPSQAMKFSDFLLRVERYPTLDILRGESGSALSRRKIILVEDIPNVFLRDAAQFRFVLRRFVRTATSGGAITPAVFIVSDSGGGNAVERSLFPNDLRAELGVTTIRFNAVAATSLTKAVARVAAAEAAAIGISRGGFSMPSQERVAELIETSVGDVRAAINALQFSGLDRTVTQSVRVFNGARRTAGSLAKADGVKRKVAGRGRGKKANADSAAGLVDGEASESLGRDVNLSLFHALGKLLYCKRRLAAPDALVLPAHLACHARDSLVENPEQIVDRIAMSPDYFISFLHQNYVDFYATIDDVANAADYLSDCDELASDWSSRAALACYSSAVGARAVVFCNTSRALADAKSTTGWKPLHKPQSVDAAKRAAENAAEARELFETERVACGDSALVTELLPHQWTLSRLADSRVSTTARRFADTIGSQRNVLELRQRTFLRETIGFSARGFCTARPQVLDELTAASPGDSDLLTSESVSVEMSGKAERESKLLNEREIVAKRLEDGVGKDRARMELVEVLDTEQKNLSAVVLNCVADDDEDFLIESFDD